MSGRSDTPTPYAIFCYGIDEELGGCGKQFLTQEEYNRQMMRPSKTWQCPVCGCYDCKWDDINYEQKIGVNMADFCKQCAKRLGFETNDFEGGVTKEQFEAGWVATGLCEGCGGGEFDYEGNCMGRCMESDHESPHKNEVLKDDDES